MNENHEFKQKHNNIYIQETDSHRTVDRKGWPVLLGLMVQQEKQENDFCLQEQVLIRYIKEVMSHSLSPAALQFANLLVEVPEFDSELLTCFRGHDAEIVKELVDTGFLIQLQHYGFQYHFRWPKSNKHIQKS